MSKKLWNVLQECRLDLGNEEQSEHLNLMIGESFFDIEVATSLRISPLKMDSPWKSAVPSMRKSIAISVMLSATE
jgi:hypothetical protein